MLFPLLFLAFLALCIFYLARRTAFVFHLHLWGPLCLFTAILGLTLLMTFLAMNQNITGTPAHRLIVLSGIVLGILIYLLLSTLAVDLVNLFFHFNAKVFGIAVLVLTIGLSAYGLLHSSRLQLKNVEIPIPGLNAPIDIVQLSDLHLGHFRGRGQLQKIVDLANSTSASMVVITGDLFESRYNLEPGTVEPLKQLHAPAYFVEGNHDLYVGSNSVKALLRGVGVRVLENELLYCKGIQLIGLNYMVADSTQIDAMHASSRQENMASVLPSLQIDSLRPSLLLHHHPTGVNYAQQAGIDLYLAGHTHGGQLFPFTILNHFLFPYNRGLYTADKTKVYVSCGSGTFGPPMKMGTPCEVTLLHLTPAPVESKQ